ncbi:hypothetical protein [Actinokineospora sp. NBRC 105648]|uniref:helix-turn-helix domain-containing protein n=1 Tax=Actinokineospora sp. NBRC 105648 TaxID=3032206 RepID=UPI0024A30580|nr:hypothetical protein [Actinokineospora sp. NBRC 105648]GLZ43302.1 hypothetical protein Acsp05_69260 [Actinokineospora sp. NBRC 105648]
MTPVRHWSGNETRALRQAQRMSVRIFAEYLGVAVRTVTKWESLGATTSPRPDSQAILDTALARADADAQRRFELLLASGDVHVGRTRYRGTPNPGTPREWQYETWTDDLDRALFSLAKQDFARSASLVDRWLRRFGAQDLDGNGLYLRARSLALLGDIRVDQGNIHGPHSARTSYCGALRWFRELGIPRRAAQVELSLVVIDEMLGHVESAAKRYTALAADDRLCGRDRARATLWVGTALAKHGDHERAIVAMGEASKCFDELDEPVDWAAAQQKLALAHRGAGRLSDALRYVEVARSNCPPETPMQRVRMGTAHAHILLSDQATAENGLQMLDEAARESQLFGMAHRLASNMAIRQGFERARQRGRGRS